MEKKNNFMPLLIYSIKEKKNWLLLSTVIIFVTTLLIPYILRADTEFFIMFGIFEMFALVFINCLVDDSFLHNEAKLTYYMSKPVPLGRKIGINIVTNTVFTLYLLVLILVSVFLQDVDNEILKVFKMLIPWLMAIILLSSLSSVLSGNTLMAGAMTIFNFCLPLIILLVIMFIFSILENVVTGFSANVLYDYFIRNIYKLDYLYFTRYVDKSIDLVYLLLLPIILIFIGLLLIRFIKRRKNENTGFIVFDGYKYFVAVFACLIIPASFSINFSRSTGIGSRLVISALLATLSYYIIIAFIEKSFRISKSSIKVFVVSMVLFALITGGTVGLASQYENLVPRPEDVELAYAGNQIWAVNSAEDFLEGRSYQDMSFKEWKRNHGIIIYNDIESISAIADLHREVLKDQTYYVSPDYYGTGNFVVAYWMKDGSRIIRDYRLTPEAEFRKEHEGKNEIAVKLLSSYEYKKQRYYYLYDEGYYGGRNLYAKVRTMNGYNTVIEEIDLKEIRDLLKKDIDNLYFGNTSFAELLMSYMRSKPIAESKQGYLVEIYEKISDEDINYLDELYLNENFTNTTEYLR